MKLREEIVVGCFAGLPEHAMVQAAIAGMPSVSQSDDRAAILSLVSHLRPRVVILPTADRLAQAVAPVASSCHEAAPAAAIFMIVTNPRDHRRSIRRATTSGARVISVESSAELRQIIETELKAAPLSTTSARALHEALSELEPPFLRQLLAAGATDPRGRAGVEALARGLSVSRRTLSRRCRALRLPPPSELVRWSRALCVAASSPDVDDPSALAQLMGFRNDVSLRRFMCRYVELPSGEQLPSVKHVVAALSRRRDGTPIASPALRLVR